MDVHYQDYFADIDATPERLRHARRAGLGAEQHEIYLPSGMPSGSKRRQIERPLAAAERFGWIDAQLRQAGEEFARHMLGARAQLGYTTSAWREIIDGSPVLISPADRKAFHQVQLRKALGVIHSRCRQPFLDWMVAAEQRDVSVRDFGRQFTALKHDEAQKGVGIAVLAFVLEDLAYHFGLMQRAKSWDTRRALEDLLRRNEESFR